MRFPWGNRSSRSICPGAAFLRAPRGRREQPASGPLGRLRRAELGRGVGFGRTPVHGGVRRATTGRRPRLLPRPRLRPRRRPPSRPRPLPIPAPTDLANGIAEATRLRLAMPRRTLAGPTSSTRSTSRHRPWCARPTCKIRGDAAPHRRHGGERSSRSRPSSRACRPALHGAGNNDPIGFDATSVQELGAARSTGTRPAERTNRTPRRSEADRRRAQRPARPPRVAARGRAAAGSTLRWPPAARSARINADMRQAARGDVGERAVCSPRRWNRTRSPTAAVAESAWLLRMAARKGRPAIGGPIGDIPAPSIGAFATPSRYAAKQLGKPYVYAGAGPERVRLLRVSRMMAWRAGRRRRWSTARSSQYAVVPARADRPAAPGRPGVLRRVRPDEPPRRHRRWARHHDRRPAHRRVRQARELLPAGSGAARRAALSHPGRSRSARTPAAVGGVGRRPRRRG